MAATKAQLFAEARALGAAQGAVGIAASWDKTGVTSLGAMATGNAARRAWMASVHARLKAAQEADAQAMYRKDGLNPDGTPLRKPGSDPAP